MRMQGSSDTFLMGGGGSSQVLINNYESLILQEVEKFSENQVLAKPEDDLLAYLIAKYTVQVPALKADDACIERHGETQIDVSQRFDYGHFGGRGNLYLPGHEVVVAIPHSGDPDLFHVRASTWTMSPPRFSVADGNVYLHFADVNLNPENVNAEIKRLVAAINDHLGKLRHDFDAWNQKLPSFARHVLLDRRNRLLAQNNIVARIGLPMKRRADDALTYAAPEVRRTISPTPPPVPSQAFKPEPALDAAEFDHILKIIGKVAIVFERSPSTFCKMGEEALRDNILVHLNGHYESATGETFNATGKTDLLIRSGEKNVFIGECKFWHGPKGYNATIDQLLSYLTWRDTKAAIIIFNKNQNFSEVLTTICQITEKHRNFKRALPPPTETSFRYIFRQNSDESRELDLAVLAFDIPTL